MYTQWFKLDRLPFRLRPEPELMFVGGEFGRAVQRLRSLLDGNDKLLLLAGEPGSGKSTLLQALTNEPGPSRIVVRLSQTDVQPPRLLELLHELLSLPARQSVAADSTEVLALYIADEYAHGRRVLIAVDDAHDMPPATLRQLLRLLSLQRPPTLLLAGEAHLADLLEWRAIEMPPLAPAIVALPRLDPADTNDYVQDRLHRAGGAAAEVFEPEALAAIHNGSGGVPALINVLCDAALHQAMARRTHTVGAQDVQAAARALHWTQDPTAEEPLTEPHVVGNALLLVARRGRPIARFTLVSGHLLIGRTPDCDLRLDSHFISRRHCQIVTSDGKSVIEDLGSTNGIAVNGGRHRSSQRHTLSAGDEIRIGDYTLNYVAADTSDHTATRLHG